MPEPTFPTEAELRLAICEIGARSWQRGLIGANEGNLSVRLDADWILATPSGQSKGHLSPNDLAVIDLDGCSRDDRSPSSEIRLHLGIYRKRTDCIAVVHAHPIVATGFAVAGEPISSDLMPEAAVVLGPVVSVPFAMPGTDEVPESLAPHLEDAKTFLLGHHGAVTLGRDLEDAYNRMETLERMARILLTARLLGGAQRIVHPGYERLLTEHLHGRLD